MSPKDAPDRNDQILDAASRVFARLGFASARMDDVASESGLSKGALYLYFKSKDQLIESLVGRMIDLEMHRLQATRKSEGTVSDRLLRFVHEYTRELERIGPLAPIVVEFYARATRHQTVREVVQRYFERFRSELSALVAEGVERDEFRQVDPDAIAVSIIGLLEGLALLWVLDRERVPISDLAPSSLDVLLRGLRPGSPSTEVNT